MICWQRGETVGSEVLGEWVSTDTILLQVLQNEVALDMAQEEKFSSENSTTYQMVLFEKDSAIAHFYAYPGSNQILLNNRFYSFDFDLFFEHGYNFTPIHRIEESFLSIESARHKLDLLSKSDSVVFIYPPDWKEQEGSFHFRYYFPQGNDRLWSSYQDTIQKYISSKYGTDDFSVRIGSSNGALGGVEIKSSKSLFDSLKKDRLSWGIRTYKDSVFDISFEFIYRTHKSGLDFYETQELGESICRDLKIEFDSLYVNTKYALEYTGFGGGATEETPLYYIFTIKCDESFWESFDQYENLCSWKNFPLDLFYYAKK